MMGERQLRQEALFYGFSLGHHVPADHLLRAIDRFVELSDVHRQIEPFYSAIGRPGDRANRGARQLAADGWHFSRSDFIYDHRRNLYVCPGGKELLHSRRQFTRPRLGVDAEGLMRYRATLHDCGACTTAAPRAEAPLPPEPASLQAAALDLRGHKGHGTGHRQDRAVRGLAATAEEGRDAVPSSQTPPRFSAGFDCEARTAR